jgi:hypothetical protein
MTHPTRNEGTLQTLQSYFLVHPMRQNGIDVDRATTEDEPAVKRLWPFYGWPRRHCS